MASWTGRCSSRVSNRKNICLHFRHPHHQLTGRYFSFETETSVNPTQVWKQINHPVQSINPRISGPMCRYVEDLLPLTKIMAGPQQALELRLEDEVDVRRLRVFYMEVKIVRKDCPVITEPIDIKMPQNNYTCTVVLL